MTIRPRQNIRRDFVTGVLSEEELGNKIFIHELNGEYGLRVHNLRTYDAVSRDVINRWLFPWAPDTNSLQACPSPLGFTYSFMLSTHQHPHS
jgi:translation initiation factor eIF-2B subunit epsilon